MMHGAVGIGADFLRLAFLAAVRNNGLGGVIVRLVLRPNALVLPAIELSRLGRSYRKGILWPDLACAALG